MVDKKSLMKFFNMVLHGIEWLKRERPVVPIGTNDNSPAIYRWVTNRSSYLVLEGRLNFNHRKLVFSRPSRTHGLHSLRPSDKSLGYYQTVLPGQKLSNY